MQRRQESRDTHERRYIRDPTVRDSRQSSRGLSDDEDDPHELQDDPSDTRGRDAHNPKRQTRSQQIDESQTKRNRNDGRESRSHLQTQTTPENRSKRLAETEESGESRYVS